MTMYRDELEERRVKKIQCKKCKRWKLLSDFGSKSGFPNVVSHWCKVCANHQRTKREMGVGII